MMFPTFQDPHQKDEVRLFFHLVLLFLSGLTAAKMASGLQLVLILGCIMMTAEAVPVPDFNNSADAPACPSGWTRFGSRCFIFYYDHKSWGDAEDFCISVGGNLASIHSYEENSFLSDMVKRVTGLHQVTWAGGYDGISGQRWRWTDGSAFKYSQFAPRKPDNYGNAEHCLEINFHVNQWNDYYCYYRRPFICAKNP